MKYQKDDQVANDGVVLSGFNTLSGEERYVVGYPNGLNLILSEEQIDENGHSHRDGKKEGGRVAEIIVQPARKDIILKLDCPKRGAYLEIFLQEDGIITWDGVVIKTTDVSWMLMQSKHGAMVICWTRTDRYGAATHAMFTSIKEDKED